MARQVIRAKAPAVRALVPLLLAAAVALPMAAHADTVDQMGATLPSARHGASAIFDGQARYVFGGDTGSGSTTYTPSNQIVRHDSSIDAVFVMAETLPPAPPQTTTGARLGTSAVWDDARKVAWIFGGDASTTTAGTSQLNQIVKYDPAAHTATASLAVLPATVAFTSAAWTGSVAYIFGGANGATSRSNQIVKFDPSTDPPTVTPLLATLPSPRGMTSAVWDTVNNVAWIFGGDTGTARTRDVLRFDPNDLTQTVHGTVTQFSNILPTSRGRTGAIWVTDGSGARAFVYGGADFNVGSSPASTAFSNNILSFDPQTPMAPLLPSSVSLPFARGGSALVFDGERAWAFGGLSYLLGIQRSSSIVRHAIVLGGLATSIQYVGASGGVWGSTLVASAKLVDSSSQARPDRPLTFVLGSTTKTAVTGADGVATASFTLPSAPTSQTLTVKFAGGDGLGSSITTASITTTKRPSVLAYDGPTSGTESAAGLSAVLRDGVTSTGLASRTVVFTLGSYSTSKVTDSAGRAQTTSNGMSRGATHAIAAFAGDSLYTGSVTEPVPYLIDWGYTFVDDGGHGLIRFSALTHEWQLVDGDGVEFDVESDGVTIVEAVPQGTVRPAPAGHVLINFSSAELPFVLAVLDLDGGSFLAAVQDPDLVVLSHAGTVVAPSCAEWPSGLSPYVVVHGDPSCA